MSKRSGRSGRPCTVSSTVRSGRRRSSQRPGRALRRLAVADRPRCVPSVGVMFTWPVSAVAGASVNSADRSSASVRRSSRGNGQGSSSATVALPSRLWSCARSAACASNLDSGPLACSCARQPARSDCAHGGSTSVDALSVEGACVASSCRSSGRGARVPICASNSFEPSYWMSMPLSFSQAAQDLLRRSASVSWMVP